MSRWSSDDLDPQTSLPHRQESSSVEIRTFLVSWNLIYPNGSSNCCQAACWIQFWAHRAKVPVSMSTPLERTFSTDLFQCWIFGWIFSAEKLRKSDSDFTCSWEAFQHKTRQTVKLPWALPEQLQSNNGVSFVQEECSRLMMPVTCCKSVTVLIYHPVIVCVNRQMEKILLPFVVVPPS